MKQKTPAQQKKDQLELMRESVLEAELKARHWKAQVETMSYSMQYEDLLPKYQEHVERMRKQEQETMDRFREQMKENLGKGLVLEGENGEMVEVDKLHEELNVGHEIK